jgi:uncharacterized integral membrane protein
MKLLWWLFLLPVIGIVAAFAVANRTSVGIDLDPLPVVFDVPLYAALMFAVLAGLLIGGISAWLAGGQIRRDARRLRKNGKLLESEIEGLRARLAVPVQDAAGDSSGEAVPDGSPPAALSHKVDQHP